MTAGRPQDEVHVPPEYVRLEPGDPFKTRRAKQLAAERGLTVFTRMKKTRDQYSRVVAYFVPPGILEAVEDEARVTAERREKARRAASAARAKAHARDVAKVAEFIREKYRNMPAKEAQHVAEHAFEVGSGRVGRTSALDLAKKIDLAVRAHARHNHTEYVDLLLDGWEKEDARRLVASQVEAVVEGWRGGQPQVRQVKEEPDVISSTLMRSGRAAGVQRDPSRHRRA